MRDRLLRGPTAHGLQLSGYLMLLPGNLILLCTGLFLLAGGRFRFRADPVLGYAVLGVFVLSVLSGGALLQAALLRVRKEAANGYVTLPFSYASFDLRDPRTGRILRRKGTPGGTHPLNISLRRWRRLSERDEDEGRGTRDVREVPDGVCE